MITYKFLILSFLNANVIYMNYQHLEQPISMDTQRRLLHYKVNYWLRFQILNIHKFVNQSAVVVKKRPTPQLKKKIKREHSQFQVLFQSLKLWANKLMEKQVRSHQAVHKKTLCVKLIMQTINFKDQTNASVLV